MGLSLFLTVAIMWPVGSEMYGVAFSHTWKTAWSSDALVGFKPHGIFIFVRPIEGPEAFLRTFTDSKAQGSGRVGMHLVIPAFVISELRTAFEMGFLVYIPFLLLDMVVASVTMSLGLVMLPPALLSLPLNCSLFSRWLDLIVRSLVRSFG